MSTSNAPSFKSLGIESPLLKALEELGYETPTPIQQQTLEPLLAGRDVLGQSETGSGKTAAFALPILQRLDVGKGGVRALILCPTRELCAQVAREVRKLGRHLHGLSVVTTTGGEPFATQQTSLERGVNIVVGTPGRTLDHLRRETLDVSGVQTMVLDEADRMLDMGFEADMLKILAELPTERQSAFFSATMPDVMESMSARYQRDATRIVVDADVPEGIQQSYVECGRNERLSALYWALSHHKHERAIVFCNFKASVDEVTRALHGDGVAVDNLHGDLDQYQRDQVLSRFRNESLRVLVATDVAGRGLDIDGLDLVVNYELPFQGEAYMHRIGRTGRKGKSGVAVSIVPDGDKGKLQEAEAMVSGRIERVTRTRTSTSMQVLARDFAGAPRMNTILISGGRKDKLRPGDILGALTGAAAGLSGDDIGKIEIHPRLSYVAVACAQSRKAATGLNKGRIKKKRYRATLIGGGITVATTSHPGGKFRG